MKTWTLEQIAIVINEYPDHGTRIAKKLGRSKKAVKHCAKKLGIKCQKIRRNGAWPWSNKELLVLDLHRSWPAWNIVTLLDRTESAIKNKRTELGWKRISSPVTKKGKLAKWRNQVLRRNNYECVYCGELSSELLQAHHIEHRSTNPELAYDVANGQTVCIACHYEQHKGRAGANWLLGQLRNISHKRENQDESRKGQKDKKINA